MIPGSVAKQIRPLLFEGELPSGLLFFFLIGQARNIYTTLELGREIQAEVSVNTRNNQSEVVV